MGAVVWNANPQGGGASTYVRTLSASISTDVTANAGDAILSLVVPVGVDERVIVSFTGTFYFGSGNGAIQLYVDGVAVPHSNRTMTAPGSNVHLELSFAGVVDGLSAGDHTIEIRNAGGDAQFYFAIAIPSTGAALVVSVVKA